MHEISMALDQELISVAGELVPRLINQQSAYKYLSSLMRRPDDMLEIISYYPSTSSGRTEV